MAQPILDSSIAGVSLLEVTRLSAMIAGAVAGAAVGWLSKRNILLALCAFMLGSMGGMSIGTGMGHLFFLTPDGSEMIVSAGYHSLLRVIPAALAGAIPTAFLMALVIAFLSLRHMHPRPSPKRTAWTGFFVGVILGVLGAVVMTIV